MNGKSFFLGFLVGGAAGSIAALLNAPASGKNTVAAVQKNFVNIKENLIEINQQLLSLLQTILTASKESRQAIAAFTSEAKELIESWQYEIQPHHEEIKKNLEEIQKNLTELQAYLQKERSKDNIQP